MEVIREQKFEKPRITGEQAERIFIGDAKSHYSYEEYRNIATSSLREGVGSFEDRNGKAVMKKHLAIADALNIDFGQAKKHENPNLSAFARGIHSGLQSIDPNYSFVPTGSRPIDFDYGADAIIHNGTSLDDLKDIARDNLPYTSVGITQINKITRSLTQNRNKISSDLEIHVPDSREMINSLVDKESFDLKGFMQEIIARSHQIHTLKLAGDNVDVLNRWISYEDFIK